METADKLLQNLIDGYGEGYKIVWDTADKMKGKQIIVDIENFKEIEDFNLENSNDFGFLNYPGVCWKHEKLQRKAGNNELFVKILFKENEIEQILLDENLKEIQEVNSHTIKYNDMYDKRDYKTDYTNLEQYAKEPLELQKKLKKAIEVNDVEEIKRTTKKLHEIERGLN